MSVTVILRLEKHFAAQYRHAYVGINYIHVMGFQTPCSEFDIGTDVLGIVQQFYKIFLKSSFLNNVYKILTLITAATNRD